MNGFAILAIYAVVMITATLIFTKKEKNVERFCVGSRKENWIMSALSIAATWIWAPALFVSTEKAYTNGFVGLFWFLIPNVLCLILFIPFAKRIRREMPEGITLSGYMRDKYKSDGVKRVYLFQLMGLSVLSTGVQLLAGVAGNGGRWKTDPRKKITRKNSYTCSRIWVCSLIHRIKGILRRGTGTFSFRYHPLQNKRISSTYTKVSFPAIPK